MSSKEQKGFVVYGDYKTVVDELDDVQVGKLFRGMLDYFVSGEEPEFTDVLKFVFIPIKQQMDRDGDKYEKRCERNRANVKKRWNKSDTNDTNVYDRIRKIRTYTNDTNTNTNKDTNKDKDTDTNKESRSERDDTTSLLNYLNQETGGSYTDTEQFDDLITNLFDKGYTSDDIRKVIKNKANEWSCDGKMRSYLRPSVLFGEKFEEYLNAPEPIEVEQERENTDRAEQLRADRDALRDDLELIETEIKAIRSCQNIEEQFDELNDLKLKQAIKEQELESVTRRLEAVT